MCILFLDIDECARGISGCAHQCNNTEGSFTCICNTGYRLSNGSQCVDIDECAESNNSVCDVNANCQNGPGSYVCTCKTGFVGNGTVCAGTVIFSTSNVFFHVICRFIPDESSHNCKSKIQKENPTCTNIFTILDISRGLSKKVSLDKTFTRCSKY